MKFAFVSAEKANHKVAVLCRVLSVSRQGYYAWCGREPSKRTREDTKLRLLVREAHVVTGRRVYGRPRIERVLRRREFTSAPNASCA